MTKSRQYIQETIPFQKLNMKTILMTHIFFSKASSEILCCLGVRVNKNRDQEVGNRKMASSSF